VGDYDAGQVEAALANTTCVVQAVDHDGMLIGFARLFGDGVGHTSLAEIIVHPAWQRRGVGRAMLARACEQCAGTVIFLDTFRGQEHFFESCGFAAKKQMVVMSRRPES
jgi:N-acetylglutamate synthase-like GNAT family acetyltransferase